LRYLIQHDPAMNTRSYTWMLVIALLINSGCTTVKRFKTASYVGEDHALVDMSLFGARLDEPSPGSEVKDLWDLSASAQTQMIQILHERYPDNAQFTAALNREYLRKGTGPVTDMTTRDLQMVFTISKDRDYSQLGNRDGTFSHADRIEYLKFSLEIPPEFNLHFTGWNRYATEYGEIKVADMSFSRSLDLDADLDAELVEGGARGSISRSEEQVINTRYLKLNGFISDRRIEIEEEGTRGTDLTGNVTANVSMVFDAFPERITIPLFTGKEWDGAPGVSALKFTDVMVPRLEEAPEVVEAALSLEYIYRHVISGEKTFQEWDDRVAYYSGKIEKRVPLFSRSEVVPRFYCIGSDADSREVIRVRTPAGEEFLLQFADYGMAMRFFDWLARESGYPDQPAGSPVEIGRHTLIFRDRPLTWHTLAGGDPVKVMPVYESGDSGTSLPGSR